MSKLKKCVICGKEFETNIWNRSVCYENHYHPCPVCGKDVLCNDPNGQHRACSRKWNTLRYRLQNEDFNIALANFLEDFNRHPDYKCVKDSILDLESLSKVDKAFVASTVDEVCGKFNVPRPDWIFDSSTYLDDPYFAMDAKGPLRLILIQESPRWYRSRNVFVSKNCSWRV